MIEQYGRCLAHSRCSGNVTVALSPLPVTGHLLCSEDADWWPLAGSQNFSCWLTFINWGSLP